MPKAYWVVTYRSVTNPAAWEAYAKIAKPAIADAGGRFLALTLPAKVYESGMNQRVVLVEFDTWRRPSPATIRPATRTRSRRWAPAMSIANYFIKAVNHRFHMTADHPADRPLADGQTAAARA